MCGWVAMGGYGMGGFPGRPSIGAISRQTAITIHCHRGRRLSLRAGYATLTRANMDVKKPAGRGGLGLWEGRGAGGGGLGLWAGGV